MNGYSRSFIPLKQDGDGFSYNDRSPVGKCVIEIVNNKSVKVTANVSNIKPESAYKVYLISGVNGSSLCVGSLSVTPHGQGEIKREFDVKTLESELKTANIDAVSVITEGKDGVSFTAVLTGYRDFEIMWKNNFKPKDTIKPIEKKSKEKPMEMPSEKLSSEEVHGLINGLQEESAPAPKREEAPQEEPHANAKIGSIGRVFEKNLRIYPCFTWDEDVEWVKISFKELAYLPIDFLKITSDALITSLYRKYAHLILGKRQNDAGYYLGMPSEYDESYTKPFERLGFGLFKECEQDGQNRLGYYVMTL